MYIKLDIFLVEKLLNLVFHMKKKLLTQSFGRNSSNNAKSIFSQNKFLNGHYTKKPRSCMIINLKKRTKLTFDKHNKKYLKPVSFSTCTANIPNWSTFQNTLLTGLTASCFLMLGIKFKPRTRKPSNVKLYLSKISAVPS